MLGAPGARCPTCGQDVGAATVLCPGCGSALGPGSGLDSPPSSVTPASNPRPQQPGAAPQRSGAYRLVRFLFLAWLIAYPVLGCASMLLGASVGNGGASMALVSGAILGLAFLIPWLIGLAVLGLLLFVTR